VIGSLRISTDALRANARALRELVAPARAAFVVKSNAYGHGLVETALAIEGLAARLCVFGIEEALALRDGGITAPVLVLGPVPEEALDEAIAGRIEIALWDVRGYAMAVQSAARKRGTRVPVHVKVDTGVRRFGLRVEDAPDAIEEYLRRPELEIAGIFSHLAAAEELDSPFTTMQSERFESVLAQVRPLFAQYDAQPIAHIAASAAGMLWPHTRLDMVRFGIALYGLWPSPLTREAMEGRGLTLEPALSFHSTLVADRSVLAGEPIGYGCSHHAPRDMRVGVVPLGYADGIPRALSNTGAFVVAGARSPIVGRVCMNATLLDITNQPQARSGAPVTLIGRDGDAEVTADDWATWAETINYEIVARLPGELPRIESTLGG
jgi:alanine racemase